jgi:hypothetical protein
MKQTNNTKTFPLRVLLTVTTGRLLTQPRNGSNGIEDLYEILGWMTNDSPMTHQLPRFGDECKPWLLKWFPELAPCSVAGSIESLRRWISKDRTPDRQEGVKMWIAELKTMFPAIKDNYEVPKIPAESHAVKNPISELLEMRGGEGVVALCPPVEAPTINGQTKGSW